MRIAETPAHHRNQQPPLGGCSAAKSAHAQQRPGAGNRAAGHAGSGGHAEPEIDWAGYTFEYLVKRVLEKQHAKIREQLTGIRRDTAAAGRSAGAEPIDAELRILVDEMMADLAEEERVFPDLLQLEQAYVGEKPGYRQHLQSVLDYLSRQNNRHLRILDGIRREAASAVSSARAVHEGQLCCRLGLLQMTLLDHLHLEHDVVFPRAARMETEMFRHRH